jgi:integrase
LETRAARDKLKVGETVHWKCLVPNELHLGYRRRKAGIPGLWIARRYIGLDANGVGRYRKVTLGAADDFQDSDGRGILSYADAQKLAYQKAEEKEAPPAHAPVPTVREALDDYLVFLRNEKKSGADAERRVRAHIPPDLANLKIDALTLKKLEAWRNSLVEKPARLRTAHGAPQRFRAAPATENEKRARRATVNRTLTILKGALNRARRHHPGLSDDAWRILKPFAGVASARPGHLSVAEAQRLINAADPESGFRALVQAALLTGCRYGELCRLTVGDFAHGRVQVRESKSGKPRTVRLTAEGVEFFRSICVGRPADALVFSHPVLRDGGLRLEAWAPSHQARPMLAACRAANIIPAVGFHQLRHTWASLAVMAGMPLMVVAENLGHTDTRICELHYAHLTASYKDKMIDQFAPTFGISVETNVVPMGAKVKQ